MEQGDDLGAPNLYSRWAGAFTDECEHVGSRFAAHAAVAYASARTKAGLGRAVATHQLAGQAQGIWWNATNSLGIRRSRCEG